MEFADRLRAAVAGRYEVGGEIGRGGMAVVFAATDVKHQRAVAIKVLRPELVVSLAADRFLREIQIASRLQHPLIVPLFDSGEAEGLLWYVMPLVQGETLRQRLAREGPLSLPEVVAVAGDAAQALAYAHQHGVVHRDIKPENILLAGGRAVIADFGIARALTQAAGEGTSSGVVIGTPAYMSPEQAAGSQKLDGRSDIYALGCVVYEMLTGQPPFAGPTPQAVIARHLAEQPPSVQVVRPSVPEAVERVVQRSLAKAPADRFRTAGEFGDALRAAGTGGGALGTSRRVRWTSIVMALSGAVVTVAALVVLGRRMGSPGPSDAVVVLPFAADSPAAEQARAIQQRVAASLRVFLRVPVVAEPGPASPAPLSRALQRARAAGAKFAVTGDVAGRETDLRLSAALYSTESGRRVAWTGGHASRDAGADTDARVLDLVAAIGDLDPTLLAFAARWVRASGSVAALEQAAEGLRRFQVQDPDGAVAALERAVQADSSFAEAYFWLSMAYAWSPRWDFERALEVAEEGLSRGAGGSRGRLGLLAAQRAYALRQADSAIAGFQAVVRDFPGQTEAWFGLGEALYHLGAFAGHRRAEARNAFDRVLAADSAFAPLLTHLLELALSDGDRHLAARVGEAMNVDADAWLYRAAVRLCFGEPGQVRATLDSLAAADFRAVSVLFVLAMRAGRADLGDRLAAILEGAGRTVEERRRGAQYGLLTGALSGRWRRALEVWRAVNAAPVFDAWLLQAYFAGLPAAEPAAAMLALAQDDLEAGRIPDFTLPFRDDRRAEFEALVHQATTSGDSAAVLALLRRLDAASAKARRSDPLPSSLAAALHARLALLAGDTVAAVAALERGLSRPAEPFLANYPMAAMAPERLWLARLYAARGEAVKARRWLASFGDSPSVADAIYRDALREVERRLP